ncbi:hypothetical protein CEP48_05965 [Mergibacter septicus]|uniref:Uncharacterized protein n=1 Tax=Mergibacter septicus TaxID=221402 RepID=A0A8E3MH05_9PAST|nr:DUF2322 family protein [Mergibacter septicus]AWX15745.1 hypothetical protein CEP47_05965 [Mergibacter septicus]QDJ14998.1 hypothetical protein CEP48_05965 [Mergibacter septicus]UTU47577.1 DUF2322 family protein [Mergibacter septicus]WMR95242.1 DUF2322 family protein [Mergibacter septicus]
MNFQAVLATLPTIDGISQIEVLNGEQVIHRIFAVEGKLGSLKVYNALAQQFDAELTVTAAEQGLAWFAEHTQDAKENPGKHPNIDFLLNLIAHNQAFKLRVIRA